LESNDAHASKNPVHRGSFARHSFGHGTVRRFRDLAQDRVQVDRPLHPPRPRRPRRPVEAATHGTQCNTREDRKRPGRTAPPPSNLGRQEAAGLPLTPAPGLAAAGSIGHLRTAEAPWPCNAKDGTASHRASRQADDPHHRAQSRLVRRLQGPVPNGEWPLLPVFQRLFQDHGLPQYIRTDNGVPFATNTLARLSRLSAWWIRLGVLPQLIEPGKPQQNGRHERMHRTLKAETTRPASAAMGSQQLRFDRFRHEFNHERPHEALEQRTPASIYQSSPRPMPNTLPPLEYPDRYEVRYVSANGGIRWNNAWVNVSTTCIGEYVGLEEIDDGIWNVYFGALRLGRLLERKMKIEDAYGRLYRHR
jgi:Integrase core domain